VHPDNGSCLFLADGERLSKNSYVKTTPMRIVKVALLQTWNHGKCRLKAKCLRELLKRIDFESPWLNIAQQHKPDVVSQQLLEQPPVHYQLPQHYQLPVQPQPPEPRHNQIPRAITRGSNYQMHGQWIDAQDQSEYVYSPHQRTPLLPRTHNIVGTPTNDASDHPHANYIFTVIIVSILLYLGYRW
jgi:hypothetical protein